MLGDEDASQEAASTSLAKVAAKTMLKSLCCIILHTRVRAVKNGDANIEELLKSVFHVPKGTAVQGLRYTLKDCRVRYNMLRQLIEKGEAGAVAGMEGAREQFKVAHSFLDEALVILEPLMLNGRPRRQPKGESEGDARVPAPLYLPLPHSLRSHLSPSPHSHPSTHTCMPTT
jgi:hypothetical protein